MCVCVCVCVCVRARACMHVCTRGHAHISSGIEKLKASDVFLSHVKSEINLKINQLIFCLRGCAPEHPIADHAGKLTFLVP